MNKALGNSVGTKHLELVWGKTLGTSVGTKHSHCGDKTLGNSVRFTVG